VKLPAVYYLVEE